MRFNLELWTRWLGDKNKRMKLKAQPLKWLDKWQKQKTYTAPATELDQKKSMFTTDRERDSLLLMINNRHGSSTVLRSYDDAWPDNSKVHKSCWIGQCRKTLGLGRRVSYYEKKHANATPGLGMTNYDARRKNNSKTQGNKRNCKS